jgi:hypothetical protein
VTHDKKVLVSSERQLFFRRHCLDFLEVHNLIDYAGFHVHNLDKGLLFSHEAYLHYVFFGKFVANIGDKIQIHVPVLVIPDAEGTALCHTVANRAQWRCHLAVTLYFTGV